MQLGCTGHSVSKRVIEPETTGLERARANIVVYQCHSQWQLGTDAGDVVGPEDPVEFLKVFFVQISVTRRGLQGLVSDFDVECIGLGIDDDVRAVDGKFLMNAIADGGSETEHRCNCGCSEQDGDAREQLAAALAREAFPQQPQEHWLLSAEDSSEGLQVGFGDDDLSAFDSRLQRDRVAATGLAHGTGNQRRGTHLAGDALLADIEPNRAADVAGVGDRDEIAVWLFEEQETDFGGLAVRAVDVDGVAVKLVVRDLGCGHRYLGADERNRRRSAECSGALRVDEFRGRKEDEDEAHGADGVHPQLFAAGKPLGFAAVGGCSVGGDDDRLAAFVLEQHHQAGEREHGDEEEEVITHDRADVTHLGGARRQYTVFRELMQAADNQLEDHEVKNDRGHAEETLQVDPDAAADEHYAEDHGGRDAEQGPGKAHQLGGVQGDAGEDQHGLNAFTQDHQEDEAEEAELRADEFGDFGLD